MAHGSPHRRTTVFGVLRYYIWIRSVDTMFKESALDNAALERMNAVCSVAKHVMSAMNSYRFA